MGREAGGGWQLSPWLKQYLFILLVKEFLYLIDLWKIPQRTSVTVKQKPVIIVNKKLSQYQLKEP